MKFIIDLFRALLRKITEFLKNIEAVIILVLATIGAAELSSPHLAALTLPVWIHPQVFIGVFAGSIIYLLLKLMKLRQSQLQS